MSQIDKIQLGKIVISASRRTDIPAFYLDWFMERIRHGYFDVKNPYNQVSRRINASPDKVHTIVFWSKNYNLFLKSKACDELNNQGYNLFFHFTINSQSMVLEPNIPPLKERLFQLQTLCEQNDPNNIVWRFDPVCYYKTSSGQIENNLKDFDEIGQKVSELGITRCVTSFRDSYRKIDKRIQFLKKKSKDVPLFKDINHEKKMGIVSRMAKLLAKKGIKLDLCCEKELYSNMVNRENIDESSCISGHLFSRLFQGKPVTKKDYGQRAKQGCQCTQSIDIGSYDLHPCFHNCLFCYANPAIDKEIQKG